MKANRACRLSRIAKVISCVVLVVSLCSPALGVAQVGRSGIVGTVTDPSGAVVPNARVTARNEATNLQWNVTTGDRGAYFLRNLPVGRYTVTVEAPGFQKAVIEHVFTEVEKETSADITLALGTPAQSVTVTAAPPLLTATSGVVGNLVTSKEIDELPLNGRSWVSLNYLTPGATKFRGASAAFSNITETVAPTSFSVNGLRGGANHFFIDGVDLQNVEDHILSILPPLDSLQEFRTQTGNYATEFAEGGAAVVSASTKSGTNELHGSVWEYIRNDALDARGFFDGNRVPPFRRNQFGASLGGPIRRDQSFIFGSYEGFRQRKGQTFLGDYPTPVMRAGDLSGLTAAPIRDPLTGQPFAGNVIRSERIHPLSTRWLNNWIPVSNVEVPVGRGNYTRLDSRPIDYDSFVVRADHRFSQKDSLFGRYMFTETTSRQPVFLPRAKRAQSRRGQNLAVYHTHTFSSTVIAEARFGYHRYKNEEPVATDTNANIAEELGVRGRPGFAEDQDAQLGIGGISVTGFSPFGHQFFGRPRKVENSSFYYNGLFFVTRGTHSLKVGGGLIRNRSHFPQIQNPTGSWTYNGFFSGLGLADFLLGYPRTIGTSIDLFDPDARRWAGGVWLQDDWKATPNLTLNFGLRWDINGRYISASDRIANYELSTPPVAVNIIPRTRPSGWDRGLVDGPNLRMLAPRFGFAHKILGGNTVVRGGYGIFWIPLSAAYWTNLSINAPWIRAISATFDTSGLPTFDRTNPMRESIAVGVDARVVDKNITDAYVQQWNLTLERAIGANLLSVAYVGNKATHLSSSTIPTMVPPGPGPLLPRQPYQQLLIAEGGVARPGPLPAGRIVMEDSHGSSNYHALQLKAQRHFTRGLGLTVSYAWGKAINTFDGDSRVERPLSQQQPHNPAAERGLASNDVRHLLTFSYIYALPFGSGQPFLRGVTGPADKLISGWQLQGVTRMWGGQPTSARTSWDNLNNGWVISYPDRVCGPNFGGGHSSADKVAKFFRTECFAPPAGGTINVPNFVFGNAGRSSLIGPGIHVWDVALQKTTSFGERYRLEFRAEFFNLFNHPNFDFPNILLGSPQFGRIFGTTEDPRDIQFGLRFVF